MSDEVMGGVPDFKDVKYIRPDLDKFTELVRGGRLRLIAQDVNCEKPFQDMPNLPVARTMWRPEPGFLEGLECWIIAGGAHHTVLSYDITEQALRDFARIMDIELVVIDKNTTPVSLERELMLSDVLYNRR